MGQIGLAGGLRVRGPDGESQPAQSQIYYMLTANHPANHLHWLEGCDTHILLEGGASAAVFVSVLALSIGSNNQQWSLLMAE